MSIRIREDNGNSGLFQSGNGAPSHLSPKGTLFLDKDAATVYINKDNLVNWTELGTGGSGSGSTLPTFTTGSVVFAGTSGLTQDNSNFFWDDTNNGLGIGTNTPASSSILDLQSVTQGILIPRMTLGQRDAVTFPAAGLQVVVTGETGGEFVSMYNSSTASWVSVGSGSQSNSAGNNLFNYYNFR